MLDPNQQQHARSIYRVHRFCRARTSKEHRSYVAGKNYYRKCQIYRKEVYSREPWLINMSLQLYISFLIKHIVTLHHVSLRLLRSVNTLTSKLKFKTILINKSQLPLKGLYLEATWGLTWASCRKLPKNRLARRQKKQKK